jgi:hypothetical protein
MADNEDKSRPDLIRELTQAQPENPLPRLYRPAFTAKEVGVLSWMHRVTLNLLNADIEAQITDSIRAIHAINPAIFESVTQKLRAVTEQVTKLEGLEWCDHCESFHKPGAPHP